MYTNLLAAEAVLDFAIQNENRLLRQLQATRDRFEVGEVTRTDVAQAEAALAGATADRVQAEGELVAATADYRRVINQEPGRLVVPEPLRAVPDSEAERSRSPKSATRTSPAQFDLAAARAEVDVATSALLPRLSVRGELTYADEPNQVLDWQREASIGPTSWCPCTRAEESMLGFDRPSRPYASVKTISRRRFAPSATRSRQHGRPC